MRHLVPAAATAASPRRRLAGCALAGLLYLLGGIAMLRSAGCLNLSLALGSISSQPSQSSAGDNSGRPDGESPESVPVFYNLFVNNETDIPRVRALVLEQLAYRQPEHRFFAHIIGTRIEVPGVTRLDHHAEGTEVDTLHSLWEYCLINPRAKVVYLHSKGSYNPIPQNEALRRYLTAAALSRECLALPDTCDVCSARFSPIPHPHTPGNMWLARCSYVQKLLDPRRFRRIMDRSSVPHAFPGCVGRQRYAAEHWVHAHPSARPCDLDGNANFTWGYLHIPAPDFPRRRAAAPRFPLATYVIPTLCPDVGQTLEWRTAEYAEVYPGAGVPAPDWWGWAFYNQSRGVRPEDYRYQPRTGR